MKHAKISLRNSIKRFFNQKTLINGFKNYRKNTQKQTQKMNFKLNSFTNFQII